MRLRLTGEETADRLLSEGPLALVIGMLLDHQVPMERAFADPDRGSSLSIADVVDAESLERVRHTKRAHEASAEGLR